MNNKSPLPKQRDKNKPLVPRIKIINQNTILSNTGPPSGNSITTDSNSEDNDNIFDWSTPCSNKTTKHKKVYSSSGTSPKTKHTNTMFISKNKFAPLSPSNDDMLMETETQITASITTDRFRHPDILDFFIHSTPTNLSLSIFNISDHSPVKLVIDGGINQVPKRPSLTTGPINWAQYKSYLQINTKLGIPLKTAQDLDQASSAFVEKIQSAAKQACHPKNNNSTASLTILDKYPLQTTSKHLLGKKEKLVPNGNLQATLMTSGLLIT